MRAAIRIVVLALLAALPLATGAAGAETQEFVIIFGTGAAEITPEAQSIVKLIAERAKAQHPAAIAVAGYGDGDGGAEDKRLGDRRAEAVIHALAEAGIAADRIKEIPPRPEATATGIPVHKVTVAFE